MTTPYVGTLLGDPVRTPAIPPGALTALGGLVQQRTTGPAGYTLVNGTGNILTWTAPNDGALHTVLVVALAHITSTETGGLISCNYTAPDGGAASAAVINGGTATGFTTSGSVVGNQYLIQAGSTFTLLQSSALTAGAAVLWAEIWAL